MAVRTLVVRPEPDTGMVDREKLVQAIMDAEATQWLAGGVFSVIVERRPTGVPGEMVTVAAVIEWKDRTDAKPQPETAVPVIAEPAPAAAPAPAAPPVDERVPVGVGAVDDEEPDEDLSEIPEALR